LGKLIKGGGEGGVRGRGKRKGGGEGGDLWLEVFNLREKCYSFADRGKCSSFAEKGKCYSM